jgi:putative FmdB family regulatory protein
MPIYEYECSKCKERFEVLQRISEDNSGLRCPKCRADKPRRLLSGFRSLPGKSSSTRCGPIGST